MISDGQGEEGRRERGENIGESYPIFKHPLSNSTTLQFLIFCSATLFQPASLNSTVSSN